MIRAERLIGASWALIAILIWSGSLVLLRLGVTTTLNAYDLAMLRFTTAALVLAPIALRHRGSSARRPGWADIALMAALFGAPYILLMAYALQSAPASAAGILNPGVMAITAVVMGRLRFGDRIGSARLWGMAVAISGLLAFLFSTRNTSVTAGHGLLVVTGAMWAGYVLTVRHSGVSALGAAMIVAIGSALCYAPLYLLWLPKQITAAPWTDIALQIGFQGVAVSVVALYAFNRSFELLGPVAGATLPALIPVATLVLGRLILAEPIGIGEAVAALLVTVGVALVLLGPALLARLRKWGTNALQGGAE
ncbi:DMT family transporter [Kushneria aurantia]|uniref:DMT family transporter n=1 Tax=Kushneria aurantia TaxID=504092 RepID=A0ABV6G407_9GAMM|nr:DMT family transporter [Kushneria aurantia]